MKNSLWTVPNVLTFVRIVSSILIFAVLPFGCYITGFVLFVLGALTDFADGWWARRFHQVTKLGRILDPFADKLLVCGTLIYLVSIPELVGVPLPGCGWKLGLAPWMAALAMSFSSVLPPISVLRIIPSFKNSAVSDLLKKSS